MSKYELTNGQYNSVMGCGTDDFTGASGCNSDFPADDLSWNDAKSFCSKLSTLSAKKVRLPTEAEWEYACRAGTNTLFYWGDTDNQKYRWFNDNAGNKTHTVGMKLPNSWGLYDMSGNVFEWCEDWFALNYYRKSPGEDPTGPKSGDSDCRAIRGGSWDSDNWGSATRCGVSGVASGQTGMRMVIEAE